MTKHRVWTTAWMATVVLAALALGQSAPTSVPASGPVAAASTTSAPAEVTAASAPIDADAEPTPTTIVFQFGDANLRDVVQTICRTAKKPLLGDINQLDGKFTYCDSRPYTYVEARGILNDVLHAKGFHLMENLRNIQLMTLKDVLQSNTLDIQKVEPGKLDEPKGPGDELVIAILPLQFIDADQATGILARMVHAYGGMSKLNKGKGLIITDTKENIRRIQRLLAQIDVSGIAIDSQLKSFPLKNASASDIAPMIEKLFGGGGNRPGGQQRWVFNQEQNRYEPVQEQAGPTFAVSADLRSNTVIVFATNDKLKLIEGMIEKLDGEGPDGGVSGTIRIFTLKGGKAEDIAKTINAALTSQAPAAPANPRQPRTMQSKVVADPGSNQLVVNATPDQMKQIEDMIKKLDEAAIAAGTGGVRTFKLEHASAQSVLPVVQNAFARRDQSGRQSISFSASADARTNSLIVYGQAADFEAIANIIKTLDVENPMKREYHVVRLKNGDAAERANALGRLLAQQQNPNAKQQDNPVRIESDRSSNSIMITCAPDAWAEIKSLMDQLQTEDVGGYQAVTTVIPLKFAKAAEVAATLQRLYDPRARTRPRKPNEPEVPPTIITFDSGSNSLILSAVGDDTKEIAKLVASFDVANDHPETQVQVKTYAVTNGSAVEMAKGLERLFARNQAARTGNPPTPNAPIDPQPKFEADSTSNQLIVSATAGQFKEIDKVMEAFQQKASETVMTVKTFQFKNGRADQLQDAVKKIVDTEFAADQRNTKAGTANARLTPQVSADARTNTLIVTAPANILATVDKLIPTLDTQDNKLTQTTKYLELVNADAVEVADAINAAVANKTNGNQPGRNLPDLTGMASKRVFAVAAKTARAVLLSGGEEDIAFAEKLIKQIDSRPGGTAVVKNFKIEFGKAEDIARVLTETVGQTALSNRMATAVPTKISAEKTSNTVVVSAPGDVVEQIGKLIKEIDIQGADSGAIIIEIVRLTAAKADPVAAALNAAQAVKPATGNRPGDNSADIVKVTADAASNSLLLTGRKPLLEETKKLIKDLDKSTGELTTETQTFTLKNAKAGDLVGVLQTILTPSARQQLRPGQTAPPDVRVAGNDKANAVVVSGPPDVLALAKQIIEKFDTPESTGPTTVQIVQLKKADATSLADAVNKTLAEQANRNPRNPNATTTGVQVVAETNSNAVLVRGPKGEVDEAVKLIKQLDDTGSNSRSAVRVFPLKNADATTIAPVLDSLFKQIANQQRGKTGTAPTFAVAPDSRTNAIVVSTTEAGFTTVEDLLTKLDVPADAAGRDIQYIPLASDPTEMAKQIDAMFLDRKKDDRPLVTPDPFGGLTVVAKEADFKAIETVVTNLDKMHPVMQVKVVPVGQGVRAEKMAEMLKRVYEQSNVGEVKIKVIDKGAAGAKTDTKIDFFDGFDGGQALLLAAPGATLAVELPPASQPTTQASQPTTLPRPAAVEVAPGVTLAVDKATNALIISGSKADIDNMQTLIDQLSTSIAATEYELRIFRIHKADPSSVARTLDALFNPRANLLGAMVPGQPGAAPVPVPMAPAAGGGRPGRGGNAGGAAAGTNTRTSVTIVADTRTKSVIVRARPTDLDLIEPMVEQLDQDGVISDIKVFVLKNADATEVANNLRQLFQISGSGNQGLGGMGALGGNPNDPRQQLVNQMLALRSMTGATVEAGSGMSITANRTTNSVVVTAPDDAMKMAERLITELDQAPTLGVMEVKTFHIQTADVNEVAAAINGIFGSRASAAPGVGGMGRQGTGGARPAGGNTVASANETARVVIVSARAEEFPLIEKVIKELDSGGDNSTATVKVYHVVGGDATSMANALRGVIQSQTTGNATAVGGNPRAPRVSASDKVRISADSSSNSIVVRAVAADHEIIAQIIQDMDKDAQQSTFKTFVLARGDATDVAAALTKMIQSWPVKKNDPKPTVSFDRGTNTVLVSGKSGDVEAIGKMISELENGRKEPVQMQVITLNGARAGDVVAALSNFYGPRAASTTQPADKTVTLSADDRTNQVIVSAKAEQLDAITKLIAKMDTPDSAFLPKRTVVALKYAQADSVSKAVAAAFAPTGGAATGNPRNPRNPAAASGTDGVTATPEPATNSVILAGPPARIEEALELIKKIDVENPDGRVSEFVVLANARAADVAKVLQGAVAKSTRGAGEQPASVSAEPTGNSVVVAGRKSEVEQLIAMAKKLDEAGAAGAGKANVKILPLKNADAATTADMITRLYAQAAQNATRAGKPADTVAVTADVRANTLIVAGSDEQFKAVEKLVNEIDQMSSGRKMQLIMPKYANPDDVMKAIQQLQGSGADPVVAPRPRPGGGTPARTGAQTSVLSGQRALLVSGSDKELEDIQKLVDALDKAAEARKQQVQIFTLTNAANSQVANALNTMYRATARPNQPEDTVSAVALTGANIVLVTASKEKMTEIADVIKQLDDPKLGVSKLDFRTFTLVNTSAVKIQPILQAMLQGLQRANPGVVINVTVEPRTNTIIVTSSGNILDQVGDIIKRLDEVPPFKAAEIAYFPLKNADAVGLAAVLTDILTPGTNGAMSPEAKALQEQVRLIKQSKGNESLPPLDLSKPIKITSDPAKAGSPGSNTLIISSTPENLAALAEVVKVLDTLPIAKGAKLQIVPLKNADATAAVTVIREVFTQGKALAKKPNAGANAAAAPPVDNITGTGLVDTLNISADGRTNSVIVSGTEEAVALAVTVLKDLDKESLSEFTEVKCYKLDFADATKIAPIIRATFAEQAGGGGAAAPGGAAARVYASRIKMLRDKQAPVETAIARTYPTLTVQAESNANVLIVAARSDMIPLIGETIKLMDVPGAGSMNVVRIYALDNADATRIQTVINGLYTGTNAALIRPEDKPTITVDTRTNALVVCSSDKTFAVIDSLLKKLDAKLPIDMRDVKLSGPYTNADAATLAATLQRMMDARVQRQATLGAKDAEAMRMIIIADPRSNMLIVGGSAEGFKLVEDLAKQLDSAGPALSGQVQIYALKNASSATISQTLSTLFTQRYQQGAVGQPNLQRQRPIFVPDTRTNTILVVANQEDAKAVESLLVKLDEMPTNSSMELVVLPLKWNDAGSVGPTVTNIFAARQRANQLPGAPVNPQDTVTVVNDAVTNALLVSASKENLELIKQLLAKIDQEPPSESGIVKTYVLVHSDVTRVAAMLQSLLTQGLYKPGLVGNNSAVARAREKVAITSDIRTNVLIVSASKENFAVIDELVKKIDVEDAPGLIGNIKIFALEHADAMRLGPMLQSMFDKKRAAEAQTLAPGAQAVRSLPVVVVPDDRTNTLLVAGTVEVFDQVTEMLKKLDGPDVALNYDFRIFYLKNATAVTIEPMVTKMFQQRVQRPGVSRPLAPVSVSSDPKVNALIIGGEKEDMQLADAIIAKLDTAAPEWAQTQVFPIAKADATQLVKTLTTLFTAQRPAAQGVTISADAHSNTILVSGGKNDLDVIKGLIEKLDTDNINDVTEIRIFALRHADAAQLATILSDALTTKPKAMTTVSPDRVTLLKLVAQRADGRPTAIAGLKEGVMVTAVAKTNSLLVQAPVDAMPLLSSLIEALDNTAPQMAEIRVFPLQNADATNMAKVLSDLFKLTIDPKTRSATSYKVLASPTGAGDPVGPEPATATLGTAEQSALTITVDARTNSLLVGGTPEYVKLVERVIQGLDSNISEDRQTVVYRLRNAQAVDIETALRKFLDDEAARIRTTLGVTAVGAAQELLARQVAIVSEKTSNTLLISGSPRYFKAVSDMVRELDQPPPQVLVQVLLAEVTLDDTTELGLQWGLQKTCGDNKINLNTDFGLTAKPGGATFNLSGGDLTLLLRALQSQGRLEVLSRPQILAADNMKANINVGQRVPFITSSQRDSNGGTYNVIQYQPVGIILNVTPHINPDGFVKMEVAPEISSISDSSVKITNDVNAIIINSRTADTTVTVQDGHTIVIGGLITNKNQVREDKVPFLGDIPLIGLAFKSTKVVKERTELLVILTPRVLRTACDADVLSNKDIRQLPLDRPLHSDPGLGEILNPLRTATPREVRDIEEAAPTTMPCQQPMIIPLSIKRDDLNLPLPGGLSPNGTNGSTAGTGSPAPAGGSGSSSLVPVGGNGATPAKPAPRKIDADILIMPPPASQPADQH